MVYLNQQGTPRNGTNNPQTSSLVTAPPSPPGIPDGSICVLAAFRPVWLPSGGWGGHRIEADVGGGVFFWVWLLEQASPFTLKVDHKGAHNVDCVDLGQLHEAVRLLS